MAAIAVVEDESLLAKSIARTLQRQGHEVETAEDGDSALALIRRMRPDLVILDLRFPGMGGLELLRTLRQGDPDVLAVIMTAYGEVETAVEAMKLGAQDFLRKPVDLDELKLVVSRALETARIKQRLDYYETRGARGEPAGELVGDSPAMQRLKALISRCAAVEGVAPADLPVVLIQGETGTGKELVARRLHLESPFADHPFVEINCAALPAPLVESELFGYERGAFTDAHRAKPGLFELAEQGTVFLDEIAELAPDTQAKLLRALEQRRVRRLGGTHERPLACRLIAATNRDLAQDVATGRFRRDLYFRVNGVLIPVPPLRERAGDLERLTDHFMSMLSRKYGRPGLRLGAGAVEAVRRHAWPGNVRELRHALERAVLLSEGRVIESAALGLDPGPASHEPRPAAAPASVLAPNQTLAQLEREAILAALNDCQGNVSRAARRLGIGREALRYRLRKMGIRDRV